MYEHIPMHAYLCICLCIHVRMCIGQNLITFAYLYSLIFTHLHSKLNSVIKIC